MGGRSGERRGREVQETIDNMRKHTTNSCKSFNFLPEVALIKVTAQEEFTKAYPCYIVLT